MPLTRTKELFQTHSNSANALAMCNYMRNKFDFYGVKSPLRKQLLKTIEAEEGRLQGDALKDYVRACWDAPQRELQYIAMDRMDKVKRKLDASFLPFLEQLVVQKSWWDTVDWIAANGVGSILSRFPELIPSANQKWMDSDNFWLQRTAILFQLKYKEKTDADLLFENILKIADSKEFFLQKAAGWALRQYSKTEPIVVKYFIDNNELSKLTIREGRKYL